MAQVEDSESNTIDKKENKELKADLVIDPLLVDGLKNI